MEDIPRVVDLNVGGTYYTVSLNTLVSFPDSMLGRMFSGNHVTRTDKDGRYFIDADGGMFRYVLDFLRRGRLFLPKNLGEEHYAKLLAEAEYFQITPFINAVNNALLSHDETPLDKVSPGRCEMLLFIYMNRSYQNKIFSVHSKSDKESNDYYNVNERHDLFTKELEKMGFKRKVEAEDIKCMSAKLVAMQLEGLITGNCVRSLLSSKDEDNIALSLRSYEIWRK